MMPERWTEVKDILHRAMELPPEQRDAFLDAACSSDESLRQEVNSLLAADEEARPEFLTTLPLLRLAKGTRLGSYEIQSMLGAGSMGEVYRARDLRLHREVAIKVLPAYLCSDPERLRRFEQEAMAAASLSHPNIVAIFQLETEDEIPYLVTEMLEGETLRERMAHARIPVRKAIDYGVQIARGLAAAHEKGIVHRDLKPENLFITKDERVKILDFGLAKLSQPLYSEPNTTPLQSLPGLVMGTAAYMAPEQVRGHSLDHRADVFACGAILYEMLAGQKPFQKPTAVETMNAVLGEEAPPVAQLAPNLPPALQKIVHRCLEKHPEQRFQSASDLAFALESLSEFGIAMATGVQPQAKRATARNLAVAAGLAALTLISIFTVAFRERAAPQPELLGSTQITGDNRIKTRIVTDGVRLYFSEIRGGYRREWQADVGSETGTIGQVSVTGGETSYISTPFTNVAVLDISRDGSELLIGEWTGTEDEARIWVMPLPSGTPRRLGTVMAHDGTFSPGGQHIVYTTGSAIFSANSDGRSIRQLASVPGWPFQPRFSPDGRHLRFSVADTNTQWTSIWEMNSDGSQVHPFFAKSELVDQQCCGNWSDDGRYFFFSQNTSHGWSDVWVYNEHMRKPVRLTTGPLGFFSPVPSADGRRLFVIGSQPRSELVRYDLKMHQFVFNLSGISADQVEYSRDGRWVTYVAFPEGTLWRSRSDGSEKLQLTSPPMAATLPTWSPDGRQIAFAAARPGMPWKLFVVSADGGAAEELLPNDHRDEMDPSWSPDGRTLAFGRRPGEAGNFGEVNIELLNIKTRHINALPSSQGLVGPRWRPQGRYLSAMTTDAQKITLFDFKTRKWRTLLTGGFAYQNWSKDGQFIYFDTLFQKNKELLRMRIPGGTAEHLASLKGIDVGVGNAGAWNSVTPDGSPMLMRSIGTSEIYRLDVVLP